MINEFKDRTETRQNLKSHAWFPVGIPPHKPARLVRLVYPLVAIKSILQEKLEKKNVSFTHNCLKMTNAIWNKYLLILPMRGYPHDTSSA